MSLDARTHQSKDDARPSTTARIETVARRVAVAALARAGLQRAPRTGPGGGVPGMPDDAAFRGYTQAIPLLEARRQGPPPGGAPASATAGPATATIVVINDCADQGSFGTSALIDGLEVLLRHAIPTAHIRSIPSHWIIEGASLSEFPGGIDLSQPLAVWPDVADQFEEVADQWLNGTGGPGVAEYLAKFEGADLVVLNGEGSIFRNNLSAMREVFLVWFAKTRLGLPAMFANGTVHLTDVIPILPAMVRKAFVELDAVVVREEVSLRNLKIYAPRVSARAMADSAYAITENLVTPGATSTAIKKQLAGRPYFCYDPGHMTIDNRTAGRSAEYQLIMALKKIVPHAVLIPSPPVHPHAKRLSLIAKETDSLDAGRLDGYGEYNDLVKDAQFVVSGRHHDTILAAMVGCPTIAFGSTSHKVHGACESIGLVGMPFDSTDLRTHLEEITAMAADYVARREELRVSLVKRSEELRVEALELGDLARDIMVSRSSG